MNLAQWLLFIGLYLVLAVVVLAPVCLKKEPIAPPEKEDE